jgi:hypothetical protein
MCQRHGRLISWRVCHYLAFLSIIFSSLVCCRLVKSLLVYKRSSLFVWFIGDKEKVFLRLTPEANVIKLFARNL